MSRMLFRGNQTEMGCSLVVLGAVAAFLAPGCKAQQIARPVASIGGSAAVAKISCHGITSVPMTADAEQTLPLRLIANVPCGQEVAVLSDLDGYTVAVRTPEGLNGYVARIYLTASSKSPSRPAVASSSALVSDGVATWQAGAPGCDQYGAGDGAIESMTVNGVTVQVSLQDTGWKFRTNVAVANHSLATVHIVPSHFLLDAVRPTLHPLTYQNPDSLASVATHQIYTTAAQARPSANSTLLETSARNDGHNYFAPVVSQGSFNRSPYDTTLQVYAAGALREGNIVPNGSLVGAVWFERSKRAEELLLRVPVNGVIFEFPLSFPNHK